MKKILVIEDDKIVRENIVELLKRFNYKVEWAENGLQGIELAINNIPDLIICDIMMPDMNGFEVLEILRHREEVSTIPFVYLTARAEMSDLRHGMDLGADDYLVKPFKAGDLIRVIETRLKKNEDIISREMNFYKEKKLIPQLTSNTVILAGNPPEVLKIDNIVFIKANNVYTDVYVVSGKKLLARKLLKEWESILPGQQYIRIHNSTLINIEYLERVEKWFNNSLRIYMKDVKEPLDVSKRYVSKVRAALKL